MKEIPLRVLVQDFIHTVSLARRQRDARNTNAVGAQLPGESLSYVQPSALGELVRMAQQMELAMAREARRDELLEAVEKAAWPNVVAALDTSVREYTEAVYGRTDLDPDRPVGKLLTALADLSKLHTHKDN